MLLNANTTPTVSYSGELRSKRKDGSTFLGYVNDLPISDEKGNKMGHIRLIADISAQKRDKQQMEALREFRELQLEVNLEFVNTSPERYKEAIGRSLEIISHYLGISHLAVAEIDSETGLPQWIANCSVNEDVKELKDFDLRELNYLIEEFKNNSYVFADKAHHSRLYATIQSCFGSSMGCQFYPILSKGELNGFMVLSSENKLPNIEVIDSLLMLSHSFAGAIQLARVDEKRREREIMFRTIAENTSDGIAVRTGNTFSFVSPAYLKILGYSEAEEKGFTADDIGSLIHPVDREPTLTHVYDCIRNGVESTSYTYRIKHKEGHYIWREDHTRFTYKEDGSLESSYIIARDITDRVNQRAKLYEKERQAKALLDALPDLVFRLDREGRIKFYKGREEDLFEAPKSFMGKSIDQVMPEQALKQIKPAFEKALKTKRVSVTEYGLEVPGKGLNYYEARFTASGEEEVTSIIRNVTEEVLNKQSLLALNAAVEQRSVSVVMTNLDGDITYVNDYFTKVTGYSKEEAIGKNPRILKTGHTVNEEYDELWATLLAGKAWSGEFLNKRKNGELYWESAIISPVKNEKGEVFRYIAIKEDVTKLKKMTEELRKLSLVASKAQDAIVITDNEGRIEWVNKSFEQLSGYSLKECIGKKPGEMLQGPETHPEHVEGMRAGLASGKAFSQTILNYRKDGTPYWLDCNITPVYDDTGKIEKFIAVERDITSLLEIQHELKREKNLLATLIDHLPSVIFMKDLESKRILVNHADLKLQGVKKKADLLGKTDFDLYPEEMAKEFQAQDQEIIRTKKAILNAEVKLERKGSIRWFLLSKIPILDEEGKVSSIIGIGKEITELKNRQFELQEAIGVMAAQNQSLKNFAYIVSHNIRSHAANIDSLVYLIEEEENEQERKNYITLLNEVSKKQLETLENLNDVIQIKESQNLSFVQLDIEAEVAGVLKILQPEIDSSLVKIKKDFACRRKIKSYKPYFESIALNLISNAVKYRNPERKNNFVKISCKLNETDWVFKVEDNGLGFDLERYKDRLFGMNQTFHQHPQARGIGLFLVKNQVEAMGGTIVAESEEGKGSAFTVTLPLV
jgi:PAS domain S-box-containing protein